MSLLDWNALKIFLAVAEQQNLVAAAESLSMSHSTVYRRLNDFEEQVGRLFERLNGQYELTELGEKMLLQGRSIRHSFDDIERELAGQDTQPKGLVRITAPASFAYHYLPQQLAKFNQLYPEIQLELLVTPLELNMTNRQADIALRITSTPPDHLVGREVKKIQWGVYGNAEYCEQFGKANNLTELDQHTVIGAAAGLCSHPTYSWIDKKLSHCIGPRTDDLVAMASLANNAHGLAVLPDDLKQPGLERLFTFEPAKANQLWVLTHPDLRKVERIKLVMKFLSDSFADGE
jgi:DNA-binding transcriptional LysR family regulator